MRVLDKMLNMDEYTCREVSKRNYETNNGEIFDVLQI
jgi:hypothetical protein